MVGSLFLTEGTRAQISATLSRFNSGKFGVPWEDTEAILEELGVEMVVYSPPAPE